MIAHLIAPDVGAGRHHIPGPGAVPLQQQGPDFNALIRQVTGQIPEHKGRIAQTVNQ